MQTKRLDTNKPLRQYLRIFLDVLPQLLIFEVIYQISIIFVIKPLLSALLKVLLRIISGHEAVLNNTIWEFMNTFSGIITMVFLFALAVPIVYFEYAVIISIIKLQWIGVPQKPKTAVIHAVWSMKSLKGFNFIIFGIYTIILMTMFNTGMAPSLTTNISFPTYFLEDFVLTQIGKIAIGCLFFLLLIVSCCLIYALPVMVTGNYRFTTSIRKSLKLVWTNKVKTLELLLLICLTWVALCLLPQQISEHLFHERTVEFGRMITYYGFSLRTLAAIIVWLTLGLAQTLLLPVQMILITCNYLLGGQVTVPNENTIIKIEEHLDNATFWIQKIFHTVATSVWKVYCGVMKFSAIRILRNFIAGSVIFMLVWAFASMYLIKYPIHDPVVVGHRGSIYAVENTLEAIQNAIDSKADYAEIDVLLSSDGIPMVIHDSNLQRLAGQNSNVYELTAQELQDITLMQNGYTGYISTLEEVVDYCEGKILLIVEYKLHGHEKADVVDAVMQVMLSSDYQKYSMYMSQEYELVAQMQQIYPDYKTGYCLFGNVGELTHEQLDSLNIDFLLVEEWMISEQLIKICRESFLPLYVWTVNDTDKMDDYLSMGVLGLITDYPESAMNILSDFYDLEGRIKPFRVPEF